MASVAIALGSFVLYLAAYRTYGRWLARRVFRIDPARVAPAHELEDGIDYVPSRRELVFGHHFTSIAGTGPIVGPAVAVVWGWVPALVWVLVGSIVMGAVHDFGSLVISMRHRGRTIADLSGNVVNGRVRVLFLLVVLVGLWIVLAVFGLVIATVFARFPSSVAPVWLQIPIAVGLGAWLRRGGSLVLGTVVAVALMYATVAWSGAVDWASLWGQGSGLLPAAVTGAISPVGFWTLVLLAYVFVASVLPVQWLLQPRDYLNTHQLLIAMALLTVGLLIARPALVAEAVVAHPPPSAGGVHAPPMLPFLFVTVACGAISGFHCLVSSGCSSRQLRTESDAQFVGYGSMLCEGFLAVLVILACVAGIGLGTTAGGAELLGVEAWRHHYGAWSPGELGLALSTFVRGSANLLNAVGLTTGFATALMGVFVASFAATTMDSACRLQRFIIAELAGSARPGAGPARRAIGNRWWGTTIAVVTAGALALGDAPSAGLARAGSGGLLLWPVFGATNQLLGGLALMVLTAWLVRTGRPAWVTSVPMAFMLAMTGWAIVLLIEGFMPARDGGNPLLLAVATGMLALQVWMVAEGVALLVRARGGRLPLADDAGGR